MMNNIVNDKKGKNIVNDKKGRNSVNDRFGHKPDGLLLLYCNVKSYSRQVKARAKAQNIKEQTKKIKELNDKHQRKI